MPSLDKPGGAVTTTVKWRFPSTHPEGRKFAAGSAALTLFAFLLGWEFIGWLLVGLTVWVFAFFRDPIRTTPRGDNFIVAPADGLITMDAAAVALCRDNDIPIVVFNIRQPGNLAEVIEGRGTATIVQGE